MKSYQDKYGHLLTRNSKSKILHHPPIDPICHFDILFILFKQTHLNAKGIAGSLGWTIIKKKTFLITMSNAQKHYMYLLFRFFIRPSSDGTYYGMVMSVRPSGSPSIRPSVRHSFPHFSPTCFDILIWNFVYYFIFMHVRSSSNAINFRHFLQELCSFLTSNSYKYAVFRTFLLHALTYWVQILYMTLF